MIAQLADVARFAREKLREARGASERIPFHVVEQYSAQAKSMDLNQRGQLTQAISISDDPRYAVLKHGTGQLAWAIVLAVDMRKSSYRAERFGAEATYLTMHTYLPTMEYIVGRAGGKVIGLRGDGLFAGFGITEVDGDRKVFTSEIARRASHESINCGRGMIEAVSDAINPLLDEEGIPGGMSIGVGIDFGHVVITRIGLDSANEITAYGKAVNRACKNSNGSDEVWVSQDVMNFYPTSPNGLVRFGRVASGAYRISNFPHEVLARRTRKPR